MTTELPAFVAELEEEEKVFGEKEFVSAEVIKRFRSRMGEYVPDLLALVRQLQGERDQAALSPVYQQIKAERDRQDQQWGEQNHLNGTGNDYQKETAYQARRACQQAFEEGKGDWRHILSEEFCEALAESDDQKLREELIQIAAVAVAWIECLDRKEESHV